MIKFWVLIIGVFFVMIYVMHKLLYSRIRGGDEKKLKKLNLYYWEGLVGLSSVLTMTLLFVLKSNSLVTF